MSALYKLPSKAQTVGQTRCSSLTDSHADPSVKSGGLHIAHMLGRRTGARCGAAYPPIGRGVPLAVLPQRVVVSYEVKVVFLRTGGSHTLVSRSVRFCRHV